MFYAEHLRCAYVPLLQVARRVSNPSWKVIVSASRGQYLKPGSLEPGFFLVRNSCPATTTVSARSVQSLSGRFWVASRSLSSGAHSRDPLARNVGCLHTAAPIPSVDRFGVANHYLRMIMSLCIAVLSKKAPLPGAGDRRVR